MVFSLEGMMLMVPPRATEKVHFTPPLKLYIQTSYQEDANKYASDLQSFDALRDEINAASSPDAFMRYLFQLRAVAAKFPFNDKAVRVQFIWADAFQRSKKHSSPLIPFERASVLFNLGAYYSKAANGSSLSSSEGLKTACALYQNAAGAFVALAEAAREGGADTISPDFNPQFVKMLELVMLAQAQECFYLKAILDGQAKDSGIAKLAAQIGGLYDEAYDAAAADRSRGAHDDKVDWSRHMQLKALYYHGIAQTRAAAVAIADLHGGEQVRRLTTACELWSKAVPLTQIKPELAALKAEFHTLIHTHKEQLEKASKENFVVYNEKVPEANALPAIARALLVKPTPLPTDGSYPPLFAKAIMKVAEDYKRMTAALIAEQNGRIDATVASMNAALVGLNLPASVETLEVPQGIPDHIVRLAADVRNSGGVRALSDLQARVMEGSQRCAALISQIKRSLDDEENEDQQMRQNFGPRWSRVASASLSKNMRLDLVESENVLRQATEADRHTSDQLTASRTAIASLSGTKADLEAALPAARSDAASTVVASTEFKALKEVARERPQALLVRVKEWTRATASLSDVVRATAANDDIVSALVQESGLPGADQQAAYCRSRLQQQYQPVIAQIDDAIRVQAELVHDVTGANQAFVTLRDSNEQMRSRDAAFKTLERSFGAFNELQTRLKDGTQGLDRVRQFYAKFEGNLLTLQQKAQDFVIARQMETRMHLSDIQASSGATRVVPSAQATGYGGPSGPSAPSYGGGGAGYAAPGYNPSNYGPLPSNSLNPNAAQAAAFFGPSPTSAPVPAPRTTHPAPPSYGGAPPSSSYSNPYQYQ